MTTELVRRTFMVGLAIAPIAASAGCASGAPADDAPGPVAAADPATYHLAPGDQLRITVFGEANLTGTFAVGAQGAVAFPLIGDVQAAGSTVSEFQQRLVGRLQDGYVRDPNVSVEIASYRPFYILGEVQHPGTFPCTANLTVMNAVAIANGFTYRADTRRVFIKHEGESREMEYALSSTTAVQPGDTIRIPERRF